MKSTANPISVVLASSLVPEECVSVRPGDVTGTMTAETGQMRLTAPWATIPVRVAVSSATRVTASLSVGSVTAMMTVRTAQMKTLSTARELNVKASSALMAPAYQRQPTVTASRSVQTEQMNKTVIHCAHATWSLCARTELSAFFSRWFVMGSNIVRMALTRTQSTLAVPHQQSLARCAMPTPSSAAMASV